MLFTQCLQKKELLDHELMKKKAIMPTKLAILTENKDDLRRCFASKILTKDESQDNIATMIYKKCFAENREVNLIKAPIQRFIFLKKEIIIAVEKKVSSNLAEVEIFTLKRDKLVVKE